MDRKVLMWAVIAVMFVLVLFLTFKAGAPSTNAASVAASTAGQAASSASYGGMVGGC